jgi:16S rRNA (cytosine1402-N4)-methyltransferase
MAPAVSTRMAEAPAAHASVMLAEAVAALALRPAGRYVDATFGRGGHSRAILEGLGPDGCLVAFDRDPEAVAVGSALAAGDPRFSIRRGNFADIGMALPPEAWDGVLFDFGVSSPQLDEAERGFSFMRDGPLDMRMDPESGRSAAEWLAEVPETELARVLFEYGEERHSRRIARAICARRGEQPFTRTLELAEFIRGLLGRGHDGMHPATRSFQAIRIAINEELAAIDAGLAGAHALLAPGGRLVAISFHSLEDRRVKRFIQERARPPAGSRRLPPGEAPRMSLRELDRSHPSAAECAVNPRARSAVMRVAERLP